MNPPSFQQCFLFKCTFAVHNAYCSFVSHKRNKIHFLATHLNMSAIYHSVIHLKLRSSEILATIRMLPSDIISPSGMLTAFEFQSLANSLSYLCYIAAN